MTHQAIFASLIYDEYDTLVETTYVGTEAFYIVNDDGFMRHIAAEDVDRQVLTLFLEQLQENKDLAVDQALRMMGRDDLFTKAAVDASIRNVSVDEIIKQGIPPQARDMMGMVGFRVVINIHGEIMRFDQPMLPDDDS